MWLRSPTTCPEWNKGTEEDEKVLHWLSRNAGLTSECITEVIELFTRRRLENAILGKMWNEAAKCAAAKQVTRPPPCPGKAVESTTAPSSRTFEQYTLLNRLSDAAKVQTKPSDDAMIIDEPAKPVAGSSKHCRGSIKNKAIFFFNWPPYFSIFSHCLQFQKTQKQEKSRITT